jgi:hypothetical protein
VLSRSVEHAELECCADRERREHERHDRCDDESTEGLKKDRTVH